MKFFFSAFFLLLLSFNLFSQHIVLHVKDSLNQEPVPFAAVFFSDSDFGIYADENGKAIIPDTIRKIRISQIAYHTKDIVLASKKSGETVFLSPSVNQLPTVTVTNVPYKRKEIGTLKKKGSNGIIATPNTNFALFIPYDSVWSSQPYITAIASHLSDMIINNKEYPSARCNICFDLRLPDKDSVPSDISLLDKRVINNSTKIYKGKETVKLKEPILFPKDGVFIVIDFITPNNPNPCLLISPSLFVTGALRSSQTWSRTMTNNFQWKKMDENDPAWSSTIRQFYGDNGIMNLRAGLQIAY